MFSILIVDDEPLTREFMKTNIPSIDTNWEVVGEAEDGNDAISFLEHHKVDLVITDIKMPVMDGLELCEKIRYLNTELEIVILSGYDEFSYAQEAMKYRVHGYLLKPIKIKALTDTLAEISQQLSVNYRKDIAFKTLIDLSTDYKSHICNSYLRAIITNSYTEIKVFHPLIYKLKVDLIKAQSTIMILKLDIESFVNQKIPLSDLGIFKYILFQTAAEITEEITKGYVFLDRFDNIIVYVTGFSFNEIKHSCNLIYHRVSSFLQKNAGITITGGFGLPANDVLEMDVCYNDAQNLILQYSILGGNTLYEKQITKSCTIEQLEAVTSSMITSFIEGDEINFHLSVKNYICSMKDFSISTILRYCSQLTDSFKKFSLEFSKEQYELCIAHIFDYTYYFNNQYTQNEIVKFLIKLIQLALNKKPEENSYPIPNKLVQDAKEYILTHFSEPISLSNIAESLNVSPNYLSKIFHELVGESYIKFLTRIRMEFASKLLIINSNEKISTIAEKSGFYNLKHFNSVFKEFYNLTPTEYRSNR